MRKELITVILLLFLGGRINLALAQGTAFTYQGALTDSSGPLNGSYDLTFTLYDSPGPGGNSVPPLGSGSPNPNAKPNFPVSGGLVTTTLDFGPSAFTGGLRWLEITVHDTKPGGATTTLSPRQQLTPLPYAIYAENAATVASGSVVQSLNGLKDNVTLAAGANVTLTPSGNTLTIPSAAGGTSIWSPIAGGGTYYNGGNVGIGTSIPDAALTLAPASEIKITDPSVPTWGTALSTDASGNGTLAVAGHDLKVYSGFENVLQLGVPEYTANGGKVVIPGGNVGIGTTAPTTKLDVRPIAFANNQDGGIALACTDGHFRSGMFLRTDSAGVPRLAFDAASGEGLSIQNGGNVGIGTSSPNAKLHVFGNAAPGADIPTDTTVLASGDGFHNRFMSANGNQAVYLAMFDTGYGELSTYDYSTGQGLTLNLNQNGGTVSVPVLEIRGGSDIAEPFPMSASDIPKGAVLVIDEEHPGNLKLSRSAYDTRVAGIMSGANGVNAGLSLHQQGVLDGGENVALSGRVYALADASYGTIHPGDLLTTSDTPGHCMKVTDNVRAQGAIIGKAMSSLQEGQGMVLVLVTLQ